MKNLLKQIPVCRMIFCIILVSFINKAVSQSKEYMLYVSPQGNDNWTGQLPEANSGNTDGPLASITEAQQHIRELKKHGPCDIHRRSYRPVAQLVNEYTLF